MMATTTPKQRKRLTERQEMKKDAGRDLPVCKADTMIQKGRHKLSKQAQRCIAFAISKVKPTDTVFQEYIFKISDLYTICGIQNQSYTVLKKILNTLSDNGWDIPLKDNPNIISRVRWFSTVRINKHSDIVVIKFHEDMMPYLLELTGQDDYYTGYSLRYILPMDSQYGPRLYELLKSYQKNNMKWFFEVENLKWLLGAETYKRWPDFQRYVLDPAVEDINTYTDLTIAYHEERGTGRGRPVERITFAMFQKKPKALRAARDAGEKKLDGEIDPMEEIKALHEDESAQQFSLFIRENMKKDE